ncbi:hypothetical protein DFJ74DRAFT_366610 [Hyaloraphidium curvatum]|nr:hypothetical protein DFJ74DRAFT_366610 [Hyaloraphidium curvatum]
MSMYRYVPPCGPVASARPFRRRRRCGHSKRVLTPAPCPAPKTRLCSGRGMPYRAFHSSDRAWLPGNRDPFAVPALARRTAVRALVPGICSPGARNRCHMSNSRKCGSVCPQATLNRINEISSVTQACDEYVNNQAYSTCVRCLDSRFVYYLEQNCPQLVGGASALSATPKSATISMGAMCGIIVAAVVAIAAIAGLVLFLLARRQKKEVAPAAAAAPVPVKPVDVKAMEEALPAYLEKDPALPPAYAAETKEEAKPPGA